ncbi:MAG TPA: hypothetical protein VGP90_05175, partial [Acidimicrobiia bacterium]|nr:hypothetical protein [Acidimicrobiia bacterium]
MPRRPFHRSRRPRTRRLAGWFVVGAVGIVGPLSVFAWGASAATGATCNAGTRTVTVASGGTATIVRSGQNVTVPGCGGSGAVVAAVGSGVTVKIEGGGGGSTLVIDLSGGHFPSSVKFDVNIGSSGGGNTLNIVGSSGPDDIVAGSFGIALNGDDVVDLGEGCDPDCIGPPSGVEELLVNGEGGDDSLSSGGSPGTGGPSDTPTTLDGGSGLNTLDFSRAAGPVTANLFQGTASGAKQVKNFARLLGSPFSDELVGDHDNYIADGAGDDIVFAGAGNNVIESGPGAKTITVGNGHNVVTVGPGGGSTISAGDGDNDITVGPGGGSTVTVGGGNNHIRGSDGGDIITAGGGDNLIEDGGGDDAITTG